MSKANLIEKTWWRPQLHRLGSWRNQTLAGCQWHPFVTCILLVLIAGCGGRGMGKVQGKVTVNGKPVTSGTIMFYPAEGPGATGSIGPDGSYTMSTHKPGDGAVIGTHKVAIHSTSVGAGSMEAPKTLDDELRGSSSNSAAKILVPGKVTWLVPEKYSTIEQSPLTAEVKAGMNPINFDIPKP
ncbi:MAG: hypothetical protein QM778_00050 [Myxococcales bacterium]